MLHATFQSSILPSNASMWLTHVPVAHASILLLDVLNLQMLEDSQFLPASMASGKVRHAWASGAELAPLSARSIHLDDFVASQRMIFFLHEGLVPRIGWSHLFRTQEDLHNEACALVQSIPESITLSGYWH